MSRWACWPLLLFLLVFLPPSAWADWEELSPGLDLGVFEAKSPSEIGDSQITILRVDPALWEIGLYCSAEESDTRNRTAREWCEEYGLVAATNAGMFAHDYQTHVGYMRSGEYVNNPRKTKYLSVAAWHPSREGDPPFRIFDLDASDVEFETILTDYSTVVQNLRLIKRRGENRWSQQPKKWSEAALGEDSEGRILLVMCRSPYTMHDFNAELVALGVQCAQHLEGGPEAQLFLQAPTGPIEIVGSYETDFNEDDENTAAWAVPNVIGIKRRSPDKASD